MADILCELHWDSKNEKVVKTYHILGLVAEDTVQFVTRDRRPFIIKTTDPKLADQLGLEKPPNVSNPDLYQVMKAEIKSDRKGNKKPVPPRATENRPLPSWLKLKCGTIDNTGKYYPWGGVGPEGF